MGCCGCLWDYVGSIWVPCVYRVFDAVSYDVDGDWDDYVVAYEQKQDHVSEIFASRGQSIFIRHHQ